MNAGNRRFGTRRQRLLAVAFMALCVAGALWWIGPGWLHVSARYRAFGATIPAERPLAESNGLMLIIAATDNDPEARDFARRVRAQGTATAIVGLPDLVEAERNTKKSCDDLGRLFHAIAKDAEHRLAFAQFRVPVLTGIGEGALGAFLGYRQSGTGTWGGVLTIDRAPDIALAYPPCLGWGSPGSVKGRYAIKTDHRKGET